MFHIHIALKVCAPFQHHFNQTSMMQYGSCIDLAMATKPSISKPDGCLVKMVLTLLGQYGYGTVLLREQIFNLYFTKKCTQKDY